MPGTSIPSHSRRLCTYTSQDEDALFQAAMQPAVGTNQASLEIRPAPVRAQPVLRGIWRGGRRCEANFRSVDKAELSIEAIMRRYLSRYF
jgi:hypothetical protein